MAITIATQFVSFTALAFAAISLVGPGLPVANKVELNVSYSLTETQRCHTLIDILVSFNKTMAATVPDITEIKQHFKFQNLPSLGQFWSSNGTPGNWLYLSNAYARRPAVARLTQDLLWTDDLWYKAQTDPRTHSRADIDKFWNRASEAMASVSSGVVYVLLPGPSVNPTEWSNTSTWALFEYPMLIRNGTTVEKICRVNYNYEFNEYTTPFKIWPEVDENQC